MLLPLNQDFKTGVLYATAAFIFWGLTPIYFKAVDQVPPLELLAQRVVWSVPLIALLVSAGRQWGNLKRALASLKVWAVLALTTCLISAAWFVFIYAMVNGKVLEASLGYFINPLVNVVLGMVFLKERLRPWQLAAVLLAAAGTVNLALSYGQVPWISLTLALCFSAYGLLRKTVPIESLNGLFVETSFLLPPALAYLIWLAANGQGAFWSGGAEVTGLLLLSGAVTALPLIWFTSAARRLPYTTLGLFQYLGPSIQLLLAVFVYHEPFTSSHLITFGCIWAGLLLYMIDSFRAQRQAA